LRRNSLQAATVFLLIFGAHVSAQTRPTNDAPTQDAQRTTVQAQAESSKSPVEDFELNIDQRHINVGEYHAETAITAEGARGIRLNVGVALRASDIDVSLRNVRGRVRFHGPLGPGLLRLLDALRIPEIPGEPARTPP